MHLNWISSCKERNLVENSKPWNEEILKLRVTVVSSMQNRASLSPINIQPRLEVAYTVFFENYFLVH